MPFVQKLARDFTARFHQPCRVIARAPGRVNLIGEHTDYCDGFVLPFAIGEAILAGCSPRDDDIVQVWSATLNDGLTWRIGSPPSPAPGWGRYLVGVVSLLRARGARLGGFDLFLDGDLPTGRGLSSSAALILSSALALAFLAGEPIETREMVDLCCRVEKEFAGVPCGIMDPSASLLCAERHALLLDCRSRRTESIPVQFADDTLLLIDTGLRHDLADGAYAARRSECAEAVAYFRRISPEVTALRDIASETVRKHAIQMPPIAAARALHVTTENERVISAAAALRASDSAALGRLMARSHDSLSQDFEMSLPAIDRLVRGLTRLAGVRGARLTGAGLGGCVIALVDRLRLEPVVEWVVAALPASAAPPRIAIPSAGASIHQL